MSTGIVFFGLTSPLFLHNQSNYMANEERCPKNPSMLKAYCAHCQGTERGTADNPRFSLKEGNFRGFPVVEVLKNGGQVTRYDSHFRFGPRKAQMLLACVHILREFWQSSDEKRGKFSPEVVEDQRQNLRIRLYAVQPRQDFERSDGLTVEHDWLQLQALPPDNLHIGLGVTKCRAICELEEELKSWLKRKGFPD